MATVELPRKPRPVNWTGNGAVLNGAVCGVIDVSSGFGLVIERLPPFAMPPPGAGLLTATWTRPARRRYASGTVVRNSVVLTN